MLCLWGLSGLQDLDTSTSTPDARAFICAGKNNTKENPLRVVGVRLQDLVIRLTGQIRNVNKYE